MLVAGTDVDIENETGRSHRVGVVAMARTPGLLGVVAQDRPFLMAIERLDRRIDVQDPGLGEQRLDAKCKMLAPTAAELSVCGFVWRAAAASGPTEAPFRW